MNKKVAVVGDGINDVEVFKQADVSFAMNSGCDLAKSNSSFILIDDDFEACMRGVMWGRNIYNNIRRFLQFQITINFAVIVTVFLGSLFLTNSPLSPVMLLWINLVMDLLAAISLGTEPPQASIIHQKAITDEEIILNKVIWRQIYAIVIWEILVMFIIIYLGKPMFDLHYSTSTQVEDHTKTYTTTFGLVVPTAEGL